MKQITLVNAVNYTFNCVNYACKLCKLLITTVSYVNYTCKLCKLLITHVSYVKYTCQWC